MAQYDKILRPRGVWHSISKQFTNEPQSILLDKLYCAKEMGDYRYPKGQHKRRVNQLLVKRVKSNLI